MDNACARLFPGAPVSNRLTAYDNQSRKIMPKAGMITEPDFGLIRFPELITGEGSGRGKPLRLSW
jgi:hypothetical protein